MLKQLTKIIKGGVKMADTIDVHDLPEEDVKFIQELVELLREKARVRKAKMEGKELGETAFTTHPSDVIGKLTRREIYDYL
jgi:hypothetical protein